jgi:hypothetical protein
MIGALCSLQPRAGYSASRHSPLPGACG